MIGDSLDYLFKRKFIFREFNILFKWEKKPNTFRINKEGVTRKYNTYGTLSFSKWIENFVDDAH
jgi:hypothetical protein